MKFVLAICFSLFFVLGVQAQSEQSENISGEVHVEDIYLAKDDGTGQAGEAVEVFLTTDVPIHCVVMLDSVKSATVRMNLIAVNVKGVKPETKVFTVSYKTNGRQNRVNFTGSPEGKWVAGTYRIDIFVDGKSSGSKKFDIKNSPGRPDEQTNLAAPKPKPESRPARRARRN